MRGRARLWAAELLVILMPNTRVTVYRGTGETNEWGDETDSHGTAVYSDIRAAVTESDELVWNQSELRSERVEEFIVRLPAGLAIFKGDQIVDDTDGSTYQVQTVSSPKTIVGQTSSRLVTKRINYTGP